MRNMPTDEVTEREAIGLLEAHVQFMQINDVRLRVVEIPAPGDAVLFFIHGFGGQLEQFAQMLPFFAGRCRIVAFDQPGHGGSDCPAGASNYTADQLVDNIFKIYRHFHGRHNVVLAHSYGTSLVSFLYRRLADAQMKDQLSGCIFLSPSLSGPRNRVPWYVPWIPCWTLDLFRLWEQRGGLESPSVLRFVHGSALSGVKRKQLAWNRATPSHVIRSTIGGLQLATLADYTAIRTRSMIVVGADDQVTPTADSVAIYHALSLAHGPYLLPQAGHSIMIERTELLNALVNKFLKKCSFPIQDLKRTTDAEPDQSKAKWGLKNFPKWKATQPVGSVIRWRRDHGGLCGIKVLREDDEDHSPPVFEVRHPNIGLIVDISREAPPYITTHFRACTYMKMPTVSKVIPSNEDVEKFFRLCDTLWAKEPNSDVAVHCHYGFNRTGFLIVAYLVCRAGFTVDHAIQTFAESRPPGIKHETFVDDLRTRYATVPRTCSPSFAPTAAVPVSIGK